MKLRWDPCVVQDALEFKTFLGAYINVPERSCLLIGGAGFDPRATMVSEMFATLAPRIVKGVFFREERTLDQPKLRVQAEQTEAIITTHLPFAEFPAIEIFDAGVTAVGGRRAVELLRHVDYTLFTDVFVDISALSCSVFFPIISFLIKTCDELPRAVLNLHLLAAEQPFFDHSIRGVPADSATLMHGFKGERSLDSSGSEAVLWIPTLAPGHDASLEKIYQFIQRRDVPIDVCPILPFPCGDPRLSDQLVAEYSEHIATWRVDHRDFVYAAESDPLDSYRAISALYSERHKLFLPFGGSKVVLSPLGNKMLSVGAMLAAIEKDLPVAMVESVGYDEERVPSSHGVKPDILRHVWLCGEAYGV